MSKEEKELLEQIVAAVIEAHGEAKKLRGKKVVEVLTIISEVLPDVLLKVEELGDKLSSADKKELAIEACLKYCNIKYVPDAIERQVIGLMIDGSISMLNKWFGKDWIDKINKAVSTVWGWFKNLLKRK